MTFARLHHDEIPVLTIARDCIRAREMSLCTFGPVGMGMVKDDYVKKTAFYTALKAVRAGRVFVIPLYNSYRTNIETTLADAYFLGKYLYPEAFADIEPAVQAEAVFDNGTITIRQTASLSPSP